jgi:hypothetical protein
VANSPFSIISLRSSIPNKAGRRTGFQLLRFLEFDQRDWGAPTGRLDQCLGRLTSATINTRLGSINDARYRVDDEFDAGTLIRIWPVSFRTSRTATHQVIQNLRGLHLRRKDRSFPGRDRGRSAYVSKDRSTAESGISPCLDGPRGFCTPDRCQGNPLKIWRSYKCM